ISDETLYLYVMGSSTKDTGVFGLECTIREDDEDGTLLSPGDAYKGVIGPAGDADEYRFIAAAGETYSILTTPTEHYLDPALRVLDENGVELFSNDDSADGVFSILSGVTFPEAGEYRIEVAASPSQEYQQRWTGVYIIQFATGTTFDWGAPHITEDQILLSPTASGVHVAIPTEAIADDTYPLAATLTIDLTGQEVSFTIQKDQPAELDLEADAGGVFFLTLTDSAAKRNTTEPVTIPGPRIIADLEGMPTALAVDRENNLYVTDSQMGGIVKYHITGASEVILSGEQTQGGTLGPNALAFDPDGNLFYANASTNSIVKALPGGATETFVSELSFPLAFTFDQDGVMYLAQIGADTINKVHPNGIIEPYAVGVRNPSGLAFSPDGALYVCNSAMGESGVYRIDENGDASIFVEPFSDSLSGMAFDRDGNLYVTDENSGYLYRISPEGESIIFARNIGATAGLAFG
ncbi:MAG: virginiamycin B lyase family protein, partial [Candidatus Hinthialibacter sp.]